MQSSQAIARVVGPVFCAIGIGMLASGPVYRDMAQQFVSGYPFIYFSGVLLLVAGLTILNVHHTWSPDWHSSITALGWVFTGIGSFRVIAPNFVSFIGGALITAIAPDHGAIDLQELRGLAKDARNVSVFHVVSPPLLFQ
jgi:hypothetical protein